MDWTDWQNTAYSMIYEYGVDIRIVITTNSDSSTYNPANDSFSSPATAGYSTKGLFTALEDRDESGHVTKIENGAMLIPAKNLPAIDDEAKIDILVGTKMYSPSRINTIMPGGDAIIYKAVLI